jgi:hypothetical protein
MPGGVVGAPVLLPRPAGPGSTFSARTTSRDALLLNATAPLVKRTVLEDCCKLGTPATNRAATTEPTLVRTFMANAILKNKVELGKGKN